MNEQTHNQFIEDLEMISGKLDEFAAGNENAKSSLAKE